MTEAGTSNAEMSYPIATDIVYCPDIFALAHYVIFKFASANNAAILDAKERRQRLEIFVNLAVLGYNISHQNKGEQISGEQLSDLVQMFMERDEQDLQRFRVIPR